MGIMRYFCCVQPKHKTNAVYRNAEVLMSWDSFPPLSDGEVCVHQKKGGCRLLRSKMPITGKSIHEKNQTKNLKTEPPEKNKRKRLSWESREWMVLVVRIYHQEA